MRGARPRRRCTPAALSHGAGAALLLLACALPVAASAEDRRPLPRPATAAWSFGELTTEGWYGNTLRLFVRERGPARLIFLHDGGWLEVSPETEPSGPNELRIRQVFAAAPYGVTPVDADYRLLHGREWLVELNVSGQVALWDVGQRRVVSQFGVPVPYAEATAVALVPEPFAPGPRIAVSSQSALHVTDFRGAELTQIPGAGGFDLVVGQLDSDPALEAAGSDGIVTDLSTLTPQASFESQDALALAAADLDGDLDLEILAATADGRIAAHDGEDGAFLRYFGEPGSPRLGALRVIPGERPGEAYLAAGELQGGGVTLRRLPGGEVVWTVSGEIGVEDFAAFDLGADGRRELLWGSGHWTTSLNRIDGVDLETGGAPFGVESFQDGFGGPEWGDVDGDGRPELVVVARASATGGAPRILTFDPGAPAFPDVTPYDQPWVQYANDFRLADLDGDGAQEILIASGWQWGFLTAYRHLPGGAFEVVSESPEAAEPYHSVAAADLDGDGRVEIVGEARREYLGPPSVVVVDGLTGLELWRVELPNIPLNPHDSELEIVDLDGDGALEIVCLLESSVQTSTLYVIDAGRREIEGTFPGPLEAISRRPGSDPRARRGLWAVDGQALLRLEWRDGALVAVSRTPGIVGVSNLSEQGPDLWLAGAALELYRPGRGVLWRSLEYGFGGLGASVAPTPGGPFRVVGAGGTSIRAFR